MDPLLAALRVLAALTGGLKPIDVADADELERLRQLIARSVLLGQHEPFFGPIDLAQLIDIADLEESEVTHLRELCAAVQAELEEQPDQPLEMLAFRREVPVAGDLPEACPPWGAGALVAARYGPFTGADNRPVWFSVYETYRHISLFGPAGGAPLMMLPVPPGSLAGTDVEFPAGSAWVSAQLFSSGAPADSHCALLIRSARLRFEATPDATEPDVLSVVMGGFVAEFELELARAFFGPYYGRAPPRPHFDHLPVRLSAGILGQRITARGRIRCFRIGFWHADCSTL